MKPLLFVTNHVPPDRLGAIAALHDRLGLELALFGGRSHHATAGAADPGVPHRHVSQREVHALAASGSYGAVACGTAGRVALPAAWRGARRAGVPFVLWTALWAHPRTPAHLVAGAPLLQRIYRDADAVVTYGEHVSAFVRARGARRVRVAPQAVDNDFWSSGARTGREGPFTATFVGRASGYKGVDVLLAAWQQARLDGARLRLVGPPADSVQAPGVLATGPVDPPQVRDFLAASHVLVMPSVPTRRFREPWGLVANEAMNQQTPVIATDAVGAAAGGLVRHGRNGFVVPANDPAALAAALSRVHGDEPLRARMGAAAGRDVAAFTHTAWAAGFAAAIDDAVSAPRHPQR